MTNSTTRTSSAKTTSNSGDATTTPNSVRVSTRVKFESNSEEMVYTKKRIKENLAVISEKSAQRDEIRREIQDAEMANTNIMNEIMTLLAEETASQEARMKDVKMNHDEANVKLEKEREDMEALRKEFGEVSQQFASMVSIRAQLEGLGDEEGYF